MNLCTVPSLLMSIAPCGTPCFEFPGGMVFTQVECSGQAHGWWVGHGGTLVVFQIAQ